jgi:hypothetical protein
LQPFVSEDPARLAGGDTNFYAYAGNSPTNFRDPSGKNPFAVALCAGGAAFGAYTYHQMVGRKATFAGYAASAGGGCGAGLLLAIGAEGLFAEAAEEAEIAEAGLNDIDIGQEAFEHVLENHLAGGWM